MLDQWVEPVLKKSKLKKKNRFLNIDLRGMQTNILEIVETILFKCIIKVLCEGQSLSHDMICLQNHLELIFCTCAFLL